MAVAPGRPMRARVQKWAAVAAEGVAAALMAGIFATFVLQIAIRYSGRLGWIAEALPILDPARYGWTLELCLALWVWLVFWGGAFVVRPRDHVTFDILRDHVSPGMRRIFGLVAAVAICAALLWSVGPTWERFAILRLKRTATLGALFGDWIRMREIYAIYIVFLLAVAGRSGWQVVRLLRGAGGDGR